MWSDAVWRRMKTKGQLYYNIDAWDVRQAFISGKKTTKVIESYDYHVEAIVSVLVIQAQ
jgi:hypothetical protein